jgi:hypothetical protein
VDITDTNERAFPDLLPVVGIGSAVLVILALIVGYLVRRTEPNLWLAGPAPSLEDSIRNVVHAVERNPADVSTLLLDFDQRLRPRLEPMGPLLSGPFLRVADLLSDLENHRLSYSPGNSA